MGIWIRSQNKSLLTETGFIYSCRYNNANFLDENDNCDYRIFSEDNILGIFPIEAEAITVLDMIEGAIGTLTVFQMPPAGFSKPACPLDLTRLENYPCSRGDCDCEICKEQEKEE